MVFNESNRLQDVEVNSLRQRSARGGLITLTSQALKFFLQTGSTMIMARLLTPADFGVVAMVASLLGFVNLIKDFGLSTATIQKPGITHEEMSGLFWVNLVSGLAVMLLLIVFSSLIAAFYKEPNAQWITIAFGGMGVISSLGAQHSAILLRQMRFGAVAARDLMAMIVGISCGIAAALFGLRFWALVIMQGSNTLAGTLFLWWKSGWRPGRPRWSKGLSQLIQFGGSLTTANFLGYANHNLDNILIGKFFGDAAVGFYSRAQSLLNKPLDQVLPPVMRVAMPMFSRLVGEPIKFKSAAMQLTELVCFGGSILLMLTIPTADWLVAVLLGGQWAEAVPVFRLLAVFGFIEPLAWLLGTILVSSGMPKAMAKWRAVSMVIVVISFLAGLPWGIIGVAAGYAASGVLTRTWLIFFVGKRIGISGWDFIKVGAPFVCLAGVVATALYGLRAVWTEANPILSLSFYGVIGLVAYTGILSLIGGGRRFLLNSLQLLKESTNRFA